jgi:hypothetical protein
METDTTVAAPIEGNDDAQPDTALEDYEFQDTPEEGEVEPEVTPEPIPEPVPMTPEQIMAQAEERAFQRMASWSGRRDKELLDTIGGLIDQKFQRTQQVVEPTETASILDDPDGWAERKIRQLAPRVMYEEQTRATTEQNNYNSALIQHAGRMMDSDPLFTDKEFGGQVIQEIQTQFGTINKQLPPDVNAQLLINSAVANIYRKKGVKTNALSGNTGVKTGVGGVSPSGKASTPAKAPKLSPDAQRLAQRWNYKAEDLERVFAEH